VKPCCVRLVMAILIVATCSQSCSASRRSSRDFVTSLRGHLLFEDFTSKRSVVSSIGFSSTGIRVEQAAKPLEGILSPDGRWRLTFIEEEDTNHDGVVDWEDRANVYLARVGSSERKRVPLPVPVVGACDWGAEGMIAVCAFALRDLGGDGDILSGDNGVVYLVDLDSGELLTRLSNPAKSSWDIRRSPDGSMVAFKAGTLHEAGELTTEAILVVDLRSGESVYEFADPEASIGDYAWSPDSTRVAFEATLAPGEYSGTTIKGMYDDVWYVEIGDKSRAPVNVTRTSRFTEVPAPLTKQGGIMVSDPLWSPDGKAIASVWRIWDGAGIWVTSVDGDGWAELVGRADHWYHLVEWRP
jgi:hypothetical protein